MTKPSAAAPQVFQRRGSGHAVNAISMAGLRNLPAVGAYAATQNVVRTITEALREAAAQLRVTEVSPGMAATGFAEAMTGEAAKAAARERDRTAAGGGSIVIRSTAQD
ncbi:SDR family NAD(P)-dependent oxidoreductase [Pseudoroseomonas ludipueritiae]|uniref:SDR family NAD(P)-dependent oxidoreductase n=1 Tax=Pseudoroseomonas ludipueritiae TaxID=198093 RepID=UPI00193202E3